MERRFAHTGGQPLEVMAVKMVMDRGMARDRGVREDSIILEANGRSVLGQTYEVILGSLFLLLFFLFLYSSLSFNIDIIKTQRPLHIRFLLPPHSIFTTDQGRNAVFQGVIISMFSRLFLISFSIISFFLGNLLIRKGSSNNPPRNFSDWELKHIVLGGTIAKDNVLQIYRSKQEYEDVVMELFSSHRTGHLVSSLFLFLFLSLFLSFVFNNAPSFAPVGRQGTQDHQTVPHLRDQEQALPLRRHRPLLRHEGGFGHRQNLQDRVQRPGGLYVVDLSISALPHLFYTHYF